MYCWILRINKCGHINLKEIEGQHMFNSERDRRKNAKEGIINL